MTRPAPETIKMSIVAKRRRFLRPRQQNANASAVPGISGLQMTRRLADVAEVLTVNWVEVVPGGVTVAGEKVHEAPAGSPEQAKETGELKLFAGEIEMEVVPLCPAVTESAAGEADTEKSGGGKLIVYIALATTLFV